MTLLRSALICGALLGATAFAATLALAHDGQERFVIAAAPQTGAAEQSSGEGNAKDQDKKPEKTPAEKMRARFPQPVLVGDLIGLPVLDGNDSTIGYIKQVVRTSTGNVQLIVPYGASLGFLGERWFGGWGRRPVAVPIEVVAILGRQIAALDMDREAFSNAPTWMAEGNQVIPSNEKIQIALGRR